MGGLNIISRFLAISFNVNSRQASMIIRITSIISVISALALLVSASVFRHQLKVTSLSKTENTALGRFYNLTHGITAEKSINEFGFRKAACEKHFVALNYPALTFAMIVLTLFQIGFALTEAWPTFSKQDKLLMLSKWLSRTMETEMYFAAILMLSSHFTYSAIKMQNEFLLSLQSDVSSLYERGILHTPVLECRYTSRDAFVAVQTINTIVTLAKVVVSLVVGIYVEQSDVPSDKSNKFKDFNAEECPLTDLPVKKGH